MHSAILSAQMVIEVARPAGRPRSGLSHVQVSTRRLEVCNDEAGNEPGEQGGSQERPHEGRVGQGWFGSLRERWINDNEHNSTNNSDELVCLPNKPGAAGCSRTDVVDFGVGARQPWSQLTQITVYTTVGDHENCRDISEECRVYEFRPPDIIPPQRAGAVWESPGDQEESIERATNQQITDGDGKPQPKRSPRPLLSW